MSGAVQIAGTQTPTLTSAARASRGSKRATARSDGSACDAAHSPPTPSRLQRHALADNLGNFSRALATSEPSQDGSLTSLKEKLIKIGAKVVSHRRYVALQMSEVAVPRNLLADILRLIAELRPPPVTLTA
jgi:hypothetical protein